MEEMRRRRESADYTSSEEEDVKPKQKIPKVPKTSASSSTQVGTGTSAPRPSQAQTQPQPSSTSASNRPSKPPKPPKALSKSELMRSRYSSKYAEYIVVFQRLVAQKNKFTTALRAIRGDSDSDAESGVSELEQEMMGLDELEELSRHHQRLYDELKDIENAYTGLTAPAT